MMHLRNGKMSLFFQESTAIKQRLKDHQIILFLDYDGTLTPIAKMPELAALSIETKNVLERLAQKKHVQLFIVSGRAMADVKQLVAIDNIVYIGNHGLEIEGASNIFGNLSFVGFRGILEHLKSEIIKKTVIYKGAFVEDKGLGLSVHYRLLSIEDEVGIRNLLGVITRDFISSGEIRILQGKKVFEIRTPIDWDKGKAVSWILKQPTFVNDNQKNLPIYIGDDTTDEDAFLAIKNIGITVSVGGSGSANAQYYLSDTDEVIQFLKFLSEEVQ